MKTTAAIFAMILMSITLSWGQNIKKYYSGYLKYQKKELEHKGGKFKRLDYYAGKTSVDDGFGGIWYVKDIRDDDKKDLFAPEYILWRSSNRFVQRDSLRFGIHVSDDMDKLPLDPKSLPVLQGMNEAFYGYIKGVSQMGCRVSLLLWIDPHTGMIDEVAFRFQAITGYGVNMGAAIPPRNYALYEDILKKTVIFDVENVDFTERDIKSNYCYAQSISFRDVSAGLELFLNYPNYPDYPEYSDYPSYPDSLDFLKGHYPPRYSYIILGSYPF